MLFSVLRRARHLLPFLAFVAALLYGAGLTHATEGAAPSEPRADPAAGGAHVALLLPTGSDAFARAAESVRAGFLEAWKRESRTLPVRLYAVTEDPQQLVASYRQALAAGARLVVGPLTRNGVNALVAAPQLITVPTLVLNVPDRPGASNLLYVLSLHVEAEAHQAAQLALSEGHRKAFTVSEGNAFARRVRDAFVQAFQRGGGNHVAEYPYATDPASLERMRQAASLGVADMVFYAVDAQKLRAVRGYMTSITAYGTSQLNPGPGARGGGADLPDVRFVDMPWMVQPDHPAVMVYARGSRESDDLERLYALGIDASRAAGQLANGAREIDLDGVTGRLTLGADGYFRRGLLATLIDGPRLTVLGETRP